MTANELADHLAATHGMTRKDAKAYLDTMFASIADAAARGEDVAIAGFGKFTVSRTAERDARNPRTGEPITIKAANKISFKAAKALKDKLNG